MSVVKLYHGSKAGIEGAIRPSSRATCDFGSDMFESWAGYHTLSPDEAISRLKEDRVK